LDETPRAIDMQNEVAGEDRWLTHDRNVNFYLRRDSAVSKQETHCPFISDSMHHRAITLEAKGDCWKVIGWQPNFHVPLPALTQPIEVNRQLTHLCALFNGAEVPGVG
jgi:hypothetical protein